MAKHEMEGDCWTRYDTSLGIFILLQTECRFESSVPYSDSGWLRSIQCIHAGFWLKLKSEGTSDGACYSCDFQSFGKAALREVCIHFYTLSKSGCDYLLL